MRAIAPISPASVQPYPATAIANAAADFCRSSCPLARLLLTVSILTGPNRGGTYVTNNTTGRVKKQIQHAIRASVRHASDRVDAAESSAGTVKVAHRSNIKIATNVGEPHATTEASATQVAPIRQTADE
jgi:hypothetical protein